MAPAPVLNLKLSSGFRSFWFLTWAPAPVLAPGKMPRSGTLVPEPCSALSEKNRCKTIHSRKDVQYHLPDAGFHGAYFRACRSIVPANCIVGANSIFCWLLQTISKCMRKLVQLLVKRDTTMKHKSKNLSVVFVVLRLSKCDPSRLHVIPMGFQCEKLQ